MRGRKRHVVVDSPGNLLAVAVDTADMSDAEGARWVLDRARARWPELVKGWADQADQGQLVEWARRTYDLDLAIVQRPAEAQGFVLLHRRRVVERSLAWLGARGAWAKSTSTTPITPNVSAISPRASAYSAGSALPPAPRLPTSARLDRLFPNAR